MHTLYNHKKVPPPPRFDPGLYGLCGLLLYQVITTRLSDHMDIRTDIILIILVKALHFTKTHETHEDFGEN